MPFAPIRPGQVLAYTEDGPTDAPALLLITGLGGLKEGWFKQVPAFAREFRVVTFDNRGVGGSTVIDRPATMRDFADDTVRLLDHLGIDRAHVWGVSMGGKIAQELALGWPERVDRLVLENTSAGEAHRVEGARPSPLKRIQDADADEILSDIVPLLFGREYRERNVSAMRAFARSRARHRPDPRGIARQWEAYEAFDSWDRLPLLPHRTLCLAGSKDALCDPANAEALAARIPNAEVVIVDGGGHSVHIEQPEVVNAVVRRFLLEGSP